MKASKTFFWSEEIKKRRTIYRFGGECGLMLSAVTLWLTTFIIIAALFIVHNRAVITPGIVFDLPSAPLSEGSQGGLLVLMFSLAHETQTGEETLVFFDDERYPIRGKEQVERLAERISESLDLGRHQDVLLLADSRVPHGDVMRFVDLARKAGARRINVSEKVDSR